MQPHFHGLSGGGHSHSEEYPDDSWNLYSMLDKDSTVALNVNRPDHVLGIFKPFVLRLNETPQLISDCDQEIIITASFVSPVHVRKIMVIGGGTNYAQHPLHLKCYVNHQGKITY